MKITLSRLTEIVRGVVEEAAKEGKPKLGSNSIFKSQPAEMVARANVYVHATRRTVCDPTQRTVKALRGTYSTS